MRTDKFSYVLALSIFLISCTKSEDSTTITTPPVNKVTPTPPSASFTYSGANTFAPANVYFTNNSTNATSYNWTFGDNTSSIASDPTHIFENQGVYTVTLKATGANGLSSSISQTINVKAAATKIQIDSIIVEKITTQPTYSSNNTFTGKIIITRETDKVKLLTSNAYSIGVIPTNSYILTGTTNIYTFTDLKPGMLYKIELIQPAASILQSDRSLGYVTIAPSLLMVGSAAYPTSIPLSYNGTVMTLKVKWLE